MVSNPAGDTTKLIFAWPCQRIFVSLGGKSLHENKPLFWKMLENQGFGPRSSSLTFYLVSDTRRHKGLCPWPAAGLSGDGNFAIATVAHESQRRPSTFFFTSAAAVASPRTNRRSCPACSNKNSCERQAYAHMAWSFALWLKVSRFGSGFVAIISGKALHGQLQCSHSHLCQQTAVLLLQCLPLCPARRIWRPWAECVWALGLLARLSWHHRIHRLAWHLAVTGRFRWPWLLRHQTWLQFLWCLF